MIQVKRVYEPAAASDGQRLLVERLWPRGIRKESLQIDAWLKDVAPSAELRKWFSHDPKKWAEFQTRYRAELRKNEAALEPLLQAVRKGTLTLVYAARDPERNSAHLLREFIEERLSGRRASRSKPAA